MEIKGINGVINTYKAQKTNAAKKTSAAVSVKNTDRIEFGGFDAALAAARSGIAMDIKADAAPQELVDAQKSAQEGVPAVELASYILMG